MRRIVLSLPLMLFLRPASAQDAFSVEIVREISMPRAQIFDNGLLWLAESTRSSKAVIDLKDKDQGVIIGNAVADVAVGWGATMPLQFKLRIDVRDNRYRTVYSQVNLVTNFGAKPIESANRDSLEPKAREVFERLTESLHAYLLAAAKDKAW